MADQPTREQAIEAEARALLGVRGHLDVPPHLQPLAAALALPPTPPTAEVQELRSRLAEAAAIPTGDQQAWFLRARNTAHWITLLVRYDGVTYEMDAHWLKRAEDPDFNGRVIDVLEELDSRITALEQNEQGRRVRPNESAESERAPGAGDGAGAWGLSGEGSRG